MTNPTPSSSFPIQPTEVTAIVGLLNVTAAGLDNEADEVESIATQTRDASTATASVICGTRHEAVQFRRLASALPALLQDAERWRTIKPHLVVEDIDDGGDEPCYAIIGKGGDLVLRFDTEVWAPSIDYAMDRARVWLDEVAARSAAPEPAPTENPDA